RAARAPDSVERGGLTGGQRSRRCGKALITRERIGERPKVIGRSGCSAQSRRHGTRILARAGKMANGRASSWLRPHDDKIARRRGQVFAKIVSPLPALRYSGPVNSFFIPASIPKMKHINNLSRRSFLAASAAFATAAT